MRYGDRKMSKGMQGSDVEELQIRLSGFSGGLPDGDFGPGTEKSVKQFQKDFMEMETPTGIADEGVRRAIERFIDEYPIDMESLKCPCGTDPKYKNWPNVTCDGFGQEINKGVYKKNAPEVEKYHKYEYPGIHRSILWATRALRFYNFDLNFIYTSAYRCSERNIQKKRTSTNHMGKAVDVDIISSVKGKTDAQVCDEVRDVGVDKCNTQLGWKSGMKSFEPKSIAPTWVHWDVREFPRKYLDDRFFCKTDEKLNGDRFFFLDVGEMPDPKAEAHMKKQADILKKSVHYDAESGKLLVTPITEKVTDTGITYVKSDPPLITKPIIQYGTAKKKGFFGRIFAFLRNIAKNATVDEYAESIRG